MHEVTFFEKKKNIFNVIIEHKLENGICKCYVTYSLKKIGIKERNIKIEMLIEGGATRVRIINVGDSVTTETGPPS